MLFSEDKYRFMYAALQEAEKAFDEDEVPVGAVVVYSNKIIGRGYNQVEKLKDATAHAEMIALTSQRVEGSSEGMASPKSFRVYFFQLTMNNE